MPDACWDASWARPTEGGWWCWRCGPGSSRGCSRRTSSIGKGTMRVIVRLAPALAALLLLAGPARAQDHAGAIGYGAGGAWFSPFNRGSGASSLGLASGWIVTGHVDRWASAAAGRFGGRLSGSYSSRPLDGLPE